MIRRPPRSTLFPYTNALPILKGKSNDTNGEIETNDLNKRDTNGETNDNDEAMESNSKNEKADDYKKIVESRSEEHTSELQSRLHLVCRLLLEKKKKKKIEEIT